MTQLEDQNGARNPSERPLLETRGLCRYFGGVKAAHDISFTVRSGLITSLIGPNGAGKTTVFNSVTGIFPPTAGEVVFQHPERGPVSIGGLEPNRICELGVARTFQNIRLFPDLPVVENVKVGLHARTKSGLLASIFRTPAMRREEAEIHAAALRYLDFVGLLPLAHDLATNLAYGDQRRLEIARALATHPQLLLLDEPAAGMNPMETDQLMELIRRISTRGCTVLLIEHDMKLVMNISDYVYVMDHGELIAEGTPEVVRTDPRVVEAYLGVQEDADASAAQEPQGGAAEAGEAAAPGAASAPATGDAPADAPGSIGPDGLGADEETTHG